ncbi:MAG: hypothetical protein H8E10_03755 [Desulfobacterales bacterium]|nr:hypothetical protein [Desulfobacterales bacterium]MBL7173095.1 hypothetical protein [Desulfobacteraceae bacterium]
MSPGTVENSVISLFSIESPLIGKQIKQGRADITVNREGFVASVLSPVSGVVTSTNTRLRSEGGLANETPSANR